MTAFDSDTDYEEDEILREELAMMLLDEVESVG